MQRSFHIFVASREFNIEHNLFQSIRKTVRDVRCSSYYVSFLGTSLYVIQLQLFRIYVQVPKHYFILEY